MLCMCFSFEQNTDHLPYKLKIGQSEMSPRDTAMCLSDTAMRPCDTAMRPCDTEMRSCDTMRPSDTPMRPATLRRVPVTLRYVPVTLRCVLLALQYVPLTLRCVPATLRCVLVTLRCVLVTLRAPVSTEHLLDSLPLTDRLFQSAAWPEVKSLREMLCDDLVELQTTRGIREVHWCGRLWEATDEEVLSVKG